jgi:creatinine amidohydrolase
MTARSILDQTMAEARRALAIDAVAIVDSTDAARFNLTGQEAHVLIRHREPAPDRETLDLHASSTESGIMARFYPAQADLVVARSLAPTRLTWPNLASWSRGGAEARRLTPWGYLGDPARFDLAKAERTIAQAASSIAELIARHVAEPWCPTVVPSPEGVLHA